MAKLYFCYQVEKGLKQLDEDKGIGHEEIERRIAEWVKEENGHLRLPMI